MISKLSENRKDQLTEAEPPYSHEHRAFGLTYIKSFLFKLLNYKNHFRTHQV